MPIDSEFLSGIAHLTASEYVIWLQPESGGELDSLVSKLGKEAPASETYPGHINIIPPTAVSPLQTTQIGLNLGKMVPEWKTKMGQPVAFSFTLSAPVTVPGTDNVCIGSYVDENAKDNTPLATYTALREMVAKALGITAPPGYKAIAPLKLGKALPPERADELIKVAVAGTKWPMTLKYKSIAIGFHSESGWKVAGQFPIA